MHPLLQLAKEAVETYVGDRRVLDPPKSLTGEMKEQAGVFVSIKKRGQLRGCIGTFEPTQDNVASEVIYNAISSATGDPRFLPIELHELGELEYHVDILTRPQPISSLDELDPRRYGVLVEDGYRRGLLLPDLEGVDTVEYQVSIARQKAGIFHGDPVQLYRFEVKRYK